MLERDWLSLAHDVLTVEPCLDVDGDGAPIYPSSSLGTTGATWTTPAIVQCARRQVFFSDGRVEVSTTTIFALSTSGHIGMQDRLSWTTMSPPSTEPPRILDLDHAEDEDGQHHIEVQLG